MIVILVAFPQQHDVRQLRAPAHVQPPPINCYGFALPPSETNENSPRYFRLCSPRHLLGDPIKLARLHAPHKYKRPLALVACTPLLEAAAPPSSQVPTSRHYTAHLSRART
ncbi:hypothetical protein ACJJTC_015633 [Scirpophaga incertulas]